MVPVVMFCQECGGAIKGQFACTCIECVSKRVETAPSASTNTARDVIAALESELHRDYQPCHQFSRDDVIQWLRQHTPVA